MSHLPFHCSTIPKFYSPRISLHGNVFFQLYSVLQIKLLENFNNKSNKKKMGKGLK